jgi:Ca2+-binding EF-hand superfamily protein
MFEYADKDGNGTLDREEVEAALKDLGFDFLTEKQIDTLMKRADEDENMVIDFEEFVKETPTTLRKSLVMLAKKNGHDLGFLA